jgi:hypothetical protein
MVKKTANSASEALEILWQEGIFESWRDFKTVSNILSRRGNNFPKPGLGLALRQAKFLTRRGPRRAYEYIQKIPAISSETKNTKLVDNKRSAKAVSSNYVDEKRIKELKLVKDSNFDLVRLIEMCEELNSNFSSKNFIASIALVRAIIDHVPPIFGFKSFTEVSNNCEKSVKESLLHLENSSRKIADAYLHIPIRRKEILPTATQVNFSQSLDVLLGEVIRKLK